MKNIVIPAHIGRYYLFKHYRIGIDIEATSICATKIALKGKRITVEQSLREPINHIDEQNYIQEAAQAIRLILSHMGKYHQIVAILPASYVLFKTVTVPFTSSHKIQKIIPFEIEPHLPFSLDTAVVDFMITRTNPETGESTVLVAAAQKEYMDQYIEIFKKAHIPLNTLTIDLLSAYNVYTSLPASNTPGYLVTIQAKATSVAYVVNKQIINVRNIPLGINQLAHTYSQDKKTSFADAQKQLFEPINHEQQQKTIRPLAEQIAFTLTSFKQESRSAEPTKITVSGPGSDIPRLCTSIQHATQLDTHQINTSDIQHGSEINSAPHVKLSAAAAISLGAALPLSSNPSFNLLTEMHSNHETSQLKKQLIAAVGLFSAILFLLIGFTIFRTQQLKSLAHTAEKQVKLILNRDFDIRHDLVSIEDMLEHAQAEVVKESTIWSSFSGNTRHSFLRYLQELSSKVDSQGLGLNLKHLSFNQSETLFEGSVKDYEALEILEEELNQSGLFSYIPTPQETTFSLRMMLKKYHEDR